MKKTITHLLLLLGIAAADNMEAQNPTLTMPPNYNRVILVDTTLPTVSGGYAGGATYGPSNMYAGPNGNALVFLVPDASAFGTGVYNKRGYRMADLLVDNSGTGFVTPLSEIVVVPDPGNCSRYYSFGSFDDGSGPAPFYSQIDMSLQAPGSPIGEKGAVITTNTNGGNIKNMYDTDLTPNDYVGARPILENVFIAITKPRSSDGNSRLVYVYNGYKMYIYKLTTTGVTYVTMYDLVNDITGGTYGSYITHPSEMEIYEDVASGKIRLAVPVVNSSYTSRDEIGLFEFSLSTGLYVASSFRVICVSKECSTGSGPATYPAVKGLEFSPNGSYLYFTHNTNTTFPNAVEWVQYSNLSNRGGITPAGVTMTDYQYSQIEVGLDGNMYFPTSNRISAITNPNSPGSYAWTNIAISQSNPLMSGSIYVMPDQVDQDTYGGFYNSTIPCCYLYSNFTIDKEFTFPTGATVVGPTFPQTVTGTNSSGAPMQVVFKSTTTCNADIKIPAGANVTFKNMRLEFAPVDNALAPALPGAKLIVARSLSSASGEGGKLTLDNAVLSVYGGCQNNKMWPGVEVLAHDVNTVTNQGNFTSSRQGRVKMINGSIIEHAYTGVSLGNASGYGGGVLDAFECTIQNCQRGLRMYPATYITSNQTIMSKCTLQVTQQLRETTINPIALLEMNEVRTPKFYGCVFQNTHSAYNRTFPGINSSTSHILVHRYTSDTYKSKFNNLSYGIFAQTTIPARSITCRSSEFNMNQTGIYLHNVHNATISTNVFKLLDNNTSQGQFSLGVNMYLCDAYSVDNNTFQNNSMTEGTNWTIGCKVEESNPMGTGGVEQYGANLIYKNTFTNLHYGCQAAGSNAINNTLQSPDLSNDVGLKFYCNTYNGTITWADIAVTSGKIDYHQGFSTIAAMNSFSTTAPVNFYQATGVPNIEYYRPSGSGSTTPAVVSTSVQVNIISSGNTNDCSSATGDEYRIIAQNPLESIASQQASLDALRSNASGNKTINGNASEAAQLQTSIDMLYHQTIRNLLNDTIDPLAYDSALVWIDRLLKTKGLNGSEVRNKMEQNQTIIATELYTQYLQLQGVNKTSRMHEILNYLKNRDVRQTLLNDSVLYNEVMEIATDTLSKESFVLSQCVLASVMEILPHPKYEIGEFEASAERKLATSIKADVYKLSNFPNPFNGSTTLTAFVPKGTAAANIVVTDVLGREVSKYNLAEGNNTLVFDKQDVNGLLFYTLYINGMRTETKLMMKNGQ